MPILKCKFCGGDIQAAEGQSVVTCEYCQREQSLTKSKSEIVVNLFNRANSLRLKNEFDKSQEIYERILAEEPDDAEAHWGIVLCKYGIEYVKEDEWKYSEIPTCHRTQYESILADVDYLAAIENADVAQRICYESEAKKIAELQKNVLEVVRNEKPFDVFICYKEKDEHGKRTIDSGIANDIYHQLTQEGFKVFYAAITLEDKLGTAYEPYIFAALNSAKVMLVLGTKPEYFNAVWVKNEWARYLKLMKNDRSRSLFPCYRDMDAYELPEEFAHLQAQDMSKVGFITDIIRGIKKIIPRESTKSTSSESKTYSASSTAAPILKRVFLCLEDKDFLKAEALLEQVFNLDPECAEAYIAKLMIVRKISTKDALYSLDFDLRDDPIYMRALRFADDEYKKVLEEYRNECIYRKANSYLAQNTIEKYSAAKLLYDKIIDYKDAQAKKSNCDIGVMEINYQTACRIKREAKDFNDTQMALQVAERFRQLGDYKDSRAQVEECIELTKLIQYKGAVEAKQRAANSQDAESVTEHYDNAISIFSGLGEYKDSSEQKNECEHLKDETLYRIACSIKDSADKINKASAYDKAARIFSQITHYKDSAEQEVECKRKAQTTYKDATYREAVELSKRDDLSSLNTAIYMFNSISPWKDSAELAQKCRTRYDIINSDTAKRNKIATLQTVWKELISKEHNLLCLKSVNTRLSTAKVSRRIFSLIYTVCLLLIVLFLTSAINSLPESKSFIRSLDVVIFGNVRLLICVLIALIAAFFSSSDIGVRYGRAIGIIVQPIGYILGIGGICSPLDKEEKETCHQWKLSNKQLSPIQKRKIEIETELKTLIGTQEFKKFQAEFTPVDIKQDIKKPLAGAIIYAIIVIVVSFLFCLFNYVIPNIKYEKAVDLMRDGDYMSAYATFESLNGFEDSNDKLGEIRKIFASDNILKIQQSNAGDTVIFGAYEQDKDTTNGQENLEWIVLVKDNAKALLITKFIIDGGPFDETGDNSTWDSCSLRKRLNEEMLSTAFTDAEQDYILSTNVKASSNAEYNVDGGDDTEDKIFLLSCEEIERYFPDEEQRIAEITEYGNYKTGTNSYWLRTPSYEGNMMEVHWSGSYHDNAINYAHMGIRPAMWVTIG